MGLDIRLPIGLMFAALGVVVTLTGLTMDNAIYQRSLGINVNLWWGLVLLTFGIVMTVLGRRGTSAPTTAEESVEGRAIEAIEHETGLESEADENE